MVYTREIYSSDSSEGETGSGGAYGSYEAQLSDCSMPVDQGQFLSDESADTTSTTPTYITYQAPPTTPCQREGEGAFRVVVEDCEDVDITSYFSDSNSEDELSNRSVDLDDELRGTDQSTDIATYKRKWPPQDR